MPPSTSPHRRSPRTLAWRSAALIAGLAAGLLCAPATALADKAEDAKAHVAKATRAHQEGRYDEARVELEAAYALAPRPELLYALGQVHAKLGNCREAATYFRRFAAAQSDPQVTKVVDQAIAACKPAPAAAPVAEPAAPALASHSSEPSASSAAPSTGEPAPVSEPPRSAPPPAPDRPAAAPASRPAPSHNQPFARARTAPTPVDPPRPRPWYKDKLGDGLVLGGIVAGVVGLVEYHSALSDLDAAEDRASTTTLAQYHDLLDSAHRQRTASIVLFGAGGALIAGGVVRYVLHGGDAEVRSVGVAPAHAGGVITYAGRF
jgi:tetratricopeptide (TPR) repeat protein